MSGGQRLVGPGGQVIVAAPGQQLVRTSGGEVSSDYNMSLITLSQVRSWSSPSSLRLSRLQFRPDQVTHEGTHHPINTKASPDHSLVAAPPVSVGGAGVQRVIIPHPGVRPGQPGSQISVPLATLQSLQVCGQ